MSEHRNRQVADTIQKKKVCKKRNMNKGTRIFLPLIDGSKNATRRCLSPKTPVELNMSNPSCIGKYLYHPHI